MANQMNLEKMHKSAKVLKTVMSVFYIASIFIIVLSIAIAICSFVLPASYFSSDHFRNGGFSLDANGMFRYNIKNTNLPDDVSMRGIYTSIAFTALIYSTALTIVCKELRDILVAVTRKEPFNEKNAGRLTKISAVLIIGSVAFRILNSFVAGIIIHTLKVENIDVVTSIDVSMLLTGFLVLVLAGIFKYGCYLQKEHDETV